MEPIELQLFPSCHECLSWSQDGELAVAAGEYIHILSPNAQRHGSGAGTAGPWEFTRLRANVFTNIEWPTTNPADRDSFSIGSEQSISTVAGIKWSHPGLEKYRRSILAVLTTNLLLSFYDSGGLRNKWNRVFIVNDALKLHFSQIVTDRRLVAQKSKIRSFAWCPPLKRQKQRQDGPSALLEPSESRWGVHVLAIANDANDLVFVRVSRTARNSSSEKPYDIEVLSVISLANPAETFPMIHTPSIFVSAVKSKARISHVSCGPWVYEASEEDAKISARSAVAVVYGTKLQIVSLDATLTPVEGQGLSGPGFSVNITCTKCEYIESAGNLDSYRFTGELQWVSEGEFDSISICAGVFSGLVTVTMPRANYEGEDGNPDRIVVREKPFFQDAVPGHSPAEVSEKIRHWEPISATTIVIDEETGKQTLHVGTLGAYAESYTCPTIEDGMQVFQSPWKKQMEDFRERFDIDRDLGGLAVSRIWGMDSWKGFLAIAFTLHPGDMVEYTTTAEERTTLMISHLDAQKDVSVATVLRPPDPSPEFIWEKRKMILQFTLGLEAENQYNDAWSLKLLYAACLCAITSCRDESILSLAHSVLEKLESATGVDLADEKSRCIDGESLAVNPKSAEQVSGPGGTLFEKCSICDAGIEWYHAAEAQCAEGHIFMRCGLTFLCIPEPGISKYCSVCETEYLNDEAFGPKRDHEESHLVSSKYHLIFEAFDTCAYCGGKFQDGH
ncbi:hypothetical protein DTO271G3_2730 [Paecilomyces variotii]|nr:hypothetical protein DTO271G3_2730 [Paecilomyces variotii]